MRLGLAGSVRDFAESMAIFNELCKHSIHDKTITVALGKILFSQYLFDLFFF